MNPKKCCIKVWWNVDSPGMLPLLPTIFVARSIAHLWIGVIVHPAILPRRVPLLCAPCVYGELQQWRLWLDGSLRCFWWMVFEWRLHLVPIGVAFFWLCRVGHCVHWTQVVLWLSWILQGLDSCVAWPFACNTCNSIFGYLYCPPQQQHVCVVQVHAQICLGSTDVPLEFWKQTKHMSPKHKRNVSVFTNSYTRIFNM